MANLLGQNIGTNYKGILNLNTLNGNLSGTLQAVTDGDGNASPLQLSTSQGQLSSVVFASGVLSRNTRDATGLRLFGGTLITTNDSGYIQLQRDDNNFGAPIFGLANANFDSNFFRWERNGTEIARLTAPGNLYLGSGGITPSARLHVRGDGTNPIARFENSAGTERVSINNVGALICLASNNEISSIRANNTFAVFQPVTISAAGSVLFSWGEAAATIAGTSGTLIGHSTSVSLASSAGSANKRVYNLEYTINNSGAQTGTATGIFLNATETALNGMTHNLMDLQVGGVSRFRVSSSAAIVNFDVNGLQVANTIRCLDFQIGVSGSRIFNSSDGVLRITNNVSNDFGRLQFGGTTSAFPAIKRNGTGIDFRLADDSAFCSISINSLDAAGNLQLGAAGNIRFAGITKIQSPAAGVITLGNDAVTDFGRLQFGGTTSSFPALKRNAAFLEVRVADDSGFAAIAASSFTIGGTSTSLASNTLNLAGFNVMFYSSRIYIDNDNRGVAINNNLAIGGGNVATNSSSVLECISTTKGFLPPRMTTAQRDLIATPAAGLVIYNTTTNVLNFYNGTAWAAV